MDPVPASLSPTRITSPTTSTPAKPIGGVAADSSFNTPVHVHWSGVAAAHTIAAGVSGDQPRAIRRDAISARADNPSFRGASAEVALDF